GVRRVAQRLGAGRAVVLDPGDGLAHLEWTGERLRAGPHRGAEPKRVDVILLQADGVERVLGRPQEELVGPLVPVLAELGAAHADDGDVVPDPVRAHGALLFIGLDLTNLPNPNLRCSPSYMQVSDARLPAHSLTRGWGGPSRSSCGCRRW